MIFKKLLPGLCVLCLLGACSSNHYRRDIIGTWALEQEDGIIHTDDRIIILTFEKDGTLSIGRMYGPDNLYKKRWIETTQNRYSTRGRHLNMKGTSGNNLQFNLSSDITHLDSLYLRRTIQKYHLGGINQTITKGHIKEVFRKMDSSYPKPDGLWEVLYINGKRFRGFRFEFHENGTFDFWIDTNGHWELKADNNGSWFHYGDLLCINYFNDIFDENSSYESVSHCYRYQLSNNKMTWESEQSNVKSFVFRKVSE